MDEHPDLTPRLERHGGERPGQLGGRKVVDRDAAAIEPLEGLEGGRGETGLVAVDFDGEPLGQN
jgi:hypothetical protein